MLRFYYLMTKNVKILTEPLKGLYFQYIFFLYSQNIRISRIGNVFFDKISDVSSFISLLLSLFPLRE